MKLTGAGQAELIRIAAIAGAAALAVWIIRRQVGTIGSAAGELVDNLLDRAGNLAADVGNAITTTAGDAVDAALTPRAGTDGWQFFPHDGVAIDPQGRYWRGTRIIWSPEW